MILAHPRRPGEGPVGPVGRPLSPTGAMRRARGERGSIIILTAICLSVLVTATALTVDLGRISLTRRDLQNVADASAMDLSRLLDGRTTAELVADPAWDAALQRSLTRNHFGTGDGQQATASVGHWDASTQVFTTTTGTAVPDAVSVAIRGHVEYEFAPGGVDTTRTGIASRTPSAGFCVGSFAARLDSSQSSLLSSLLGQSLGVTAIGYSGLAGGHVRLDALAADLGLSVGSPTELLATQVRLVDLVRAEATVLRDSGDAVRATILDDLALALPTPNVPVTLGSLLSIASGGEAAAASADLDALELLTTTAWIVNGTNFLDLPDVGITLPGGLTTTTAQVQVIEQPMCSFGPGGTVAHTSQVKLKLTVAATVPGVSDSTITIALDGGNGTATSSNIVCGAPQGLDLGVQTSLVTSRTDVRSRLSVLGVPIADVQLHATSGATPSTHSVDVVVPPDVFGDPIQVPTPGLNLGGASLVTDSIDVLGIPVGTTVGVLVDTLGATVITPLLTQVDDLLVTPLSGILGLTVAGADVTPVSVACTSPRLVG